MTKKYEEYFGNGSRLSFGRKTLRNIFANWIRESKFLPKQNEQTDDFLVRLVCSRQEIPPEYCTVLHKTFAASPHQIKSYLVSSLWFYTKPQSSDLTDLNSRLPGARLVGRIPIIEVDTKGWSTRIINDWFDNFSRIFHPTTLGVILFRLPIGSWALRRHPSPKRY